MQQDFTKKQEVLYVGAVKVFSNEGVQKKLVNRIILINLKSVYFYQDPQGRSEKYQSLKKQRDPIKPSTVLKPQFEINLAGKSVELIHSTDGGFKAYIKQLGLIEQTKSISSLCLIISQSQNLIEILGVEKQAEGKKLTAALRKHIGLIQYLTYIQKAKLNFNEKLCRRFMDCIQGIATIDPLDFKDEQQQQQIQIYLQLINSIPIIQQLILFYRINDEISLEYTSKISQLAKNKTKSLTISSIQLFNTYLLKCLSNNFTTLQKLNLSSNNLTDGCFSIITNAILKKQSVGLEVLNLSKNHIALPIQCKDNFVEFMENLQTQLSLNLQENKIQSIQLILKYVINTQDTPLKYFNIRKNLINEQNMCRIVQQYNKYRHKWQLIVDQVILSDINIFQFLAFQSKNKSNLQFRFYKSQKYDEIKDEESQKQELITIKIQNKQLIQNLNYAYQYGDFYAVRKNLKYLSQRDIEKKDLKLQFEDKQKKIEEDVILKDCKLLFNFQTNKQTLNDKLDLLVRKIIRKRICGSGADYILYLKHLRDQKIKNYLQTRYNPLKLLFLNDIQNYGKYLENSRLTEEPFVNNDYWNYVKLKQQQIKQIIQSKYPQSNIQQQNKNNRYNQLRRVTFVISQNIKAYDYQISMLQLKLPCCKILRTYYKRNFKPILTLKTIQQPPPTIVSNTLQFISHYDISNYSFNNQARNINLQQYKGILNSLIISYDEQSQLKTFIQITNYFLSYLYLTPSKITVETIKYLEYIINTIRESKNQQLLSQQLYLHMMTFNTSTILSKGILKSIFQYLTMVIINSQKIKPYIIAYLIKYQQKNIESIRLNFNNQNKLKWVYSSKSLETFFNKDGKIDVTIQDLYGNYAIISIYHLANVNQLMRMLSLHPTFSNIQIKDYWIFKANSSLLLPGYQIIGELVANNTVLILRRVFFECRLLNRRVLKSMSKDSLNYLYSQIKWNYLNGKFTIENQEMEQYIKKCSSQLMRVEMILKKKYDEEYMSEMIKQIDSLIPQNIMIKIDKIEILEIVKKNINSKVTIEQAIVNFIFEASFYCQSISIQYIANDLTVRITLNIVQIVIQQVQNLISKKSIKWSRIYNVIFDEQSKTLTIYYFQNQFQLKNYQIKSIINQQNVQLQCLINIYLLICGICIKIIQSDLNSLYYSANQGRCDCKPSNQNKPSIQKISVLQSMIKFTKIKTLDQLKKQNNNNKILYQQKQIILKSQKSNNQKNDDVGKKGMQIEDIISQLDKNNKQQVIINRRSSDKRRQLPRRSRDR